MSKSQLNSTLENHFLTQSTFKRNSRYYDVPAIMNLQNKYSIKRRKPLQSPPNSPKLQSSFTNSTEALSSKVNNEIGKFRNRVSFIDTKSAYQRQYSSPSSPKLKSFSIEKMSSRQYHDEIKNKPIEDQRLFNNFKIQKHDLSKTCDFGKLRGRKFDFQLKHMNDIYHESHKPYQYCFYQPTTLKPKVNYKLENKQQQRYFFRSRRKEDFPATVMDPEKVDQGLKIASNFKGSNIKHPDISPFYLTSGRELPSYTDNRFNTNLTQFRRDSNGKLVQPKLDYTVKKMKQQMQAQRKEKLRKSKRPSFTRNQICDQRYFQMNIQA